ncbi:MAG: GTP 3',8-cyclase MoaA [Butyribacter sp.]|uniref:GTP 3',8-cyclase MoaA n=1 Tax=Butyribacter TaxID=2822463 RepID=UPI0038461EB9|nr:GTP 3',8-cyclase MoaA [Clostridium sp.]MCQ5166669.1 GTP 3',8-cyclase MoaA [Roseburia hominis]
MTDGYGRKIDYMRISLTDNCNLRCSYCMPEGKISDIHYLPVETVLKCVESAVCLGITNFRLTGGEPLIYPDIEKLITKMRNVSGVNFIGITTNGVFLSEKADVLKMAGTDSINVSLDTVDSDEFRKITGRNCLKNVIDGIDAALDSRIKLKINTVLRSEVDVLKMTEFANDKNIDIRFIELMPVGIGEKNDIIPRKAVIEKLEKKYGKVCGVSKMHDENGPAEYYAFRKLGVRVGLIQAVHGKFCDRCNRIRITSDAGLKPCLADSRIIDLKEALDIGKDELTKIMKKAIYEKPKSHHFEDILCEKETKTMNMIGG